MMHFSAPQITRRAACALLMLGASFIINGCAKTGSIGSEDPKIGLFGVQAVEIPTGKSSFFYRDAKGRDVKVFSYKAANFTATSTIWFTMHGLAREAENTRDEWLVAADLNGLLILAPEFSEAAFPKSADYTISEINGADFSKSNYATIEGIFDSTLAATGSQQKVYGMYGHSAGGQFIQKMMMLMPTVRTDYAVTANSGWYLLPSCTKVPNEVAAFPYSFADGPYSAADCPAALTRGLSRNVLVLLGAEDRDPAHPQLSKTAGAMMQGSTRFERGAFFIDQMRKAGEAQNKAHRWKAQVVPSVGHDASQMAQSAVFLAYRPTRRMQ